MFKKTILIVSFILGLGVVGWNCKKSSSGRDEVYIKFSPEGLAYVKLTPGKYLVYKDSASGATDSVVVTESSVERAYYAGNGLSFPNTYPAYHHDQFTLVLTRYDQTQSELWFVAHASVEPGAYYSSYDNAPLFLTSTDSLRVFAYHQDHVNTILTSITVEGRTYGNVLMATASNGLDPGDPRYKEATYYWAKNTGFIKRDLLVGGVAKTQMLLRSN